MIALLTVGSKQVSCMPIIHIGRDFQVCTVHVLVSHTSFYLLATLEKEPLSQECYPVSEYLIVIMTQHTLTIALSSTHVVME